MSLLTFFLGKTPMLTDNPIFSLKVVYQIAALVYRRVKQPLSPFKNSPNAYEPCPVETGHFLLRFLNGK